MALKIFSFFDFQKFKIPIRNIFYYNFKYDYKLKENQLTVFVELFGNIDKKILRVFEKYIIICLRDNVSTFNKFFT